jgi:hypothetical protein
MKLSCFFTLSFITLNICFRKDVDVARCFRKLGVFPNKSIDDEGKERFHPLSITGHFNGEFPDWLYQYASNPAQKVRRISFYIILYFSYLSFILIELQLL